MHWRVLPAICVTMVFLLGAAPKGTTTRVTIDNMSFSPAAVSVKPGDTVAWTNRDGQDHTVTAGDGSFDSGNLKPGDTFSYTFTKAGKFSYRCSLHPRMKGSVTVGGS